MPTGKIVASDDKGFKIKWESKEYRADIENARKMGFKKNKFVDFEIGTDEKGRNIAKNVKIVENQPSTEPILENHSSPLKSTKPKRRNHQFSTQSKPGNPDQSEAIMNDSPYHFVPIPVENDQVVCVLDEPVFHDGSRKLISGELRCTLTALTPLLVGNYSYKVSQLFPPSENKDDNEEDRTVTLPKEWKIPFPVSTKKNILEPMRWIDGRVIIPGSSIKGMIRNSLAALLGTPMERVEEKEYTYRPNIWSSKDDSKYKCLPAIVEDTNSDTLNIRVLFSVNDVKFPKDDNQRNEYRRNNSYIEFSYMTGIDGDFLLGKTFMGKNEETDTRNLQNHKFVYVKKSIINDSNDRILTIPNPIKKFHKKTLESLIDSSKGHLKKDHQLYDEQLFKVITNNINSIITNGYQKNQVIFVEIRVNSDFPKSKVVSFGHHLYYRWRYRDTVQSRHSHSNTLRPILRAQPAENEKKEDGSPKQLSGARLLFGYVSGKNVKGLEELGKEPFQHLAGRIAINHALECPNGKTEDQRFLKHDQHFVVPLKPLGLPRPSAVEFYLQQDVEKYKRNDAGILITYGDLLEGDDSGELNGRKFYLHHPSTVTDSTCYEDSQGENVKSNQSTFARFVSKPGSEFKFTIRFRDLRKWELGALLFVLELDKHIDELNKHLNWQPVQDAVKKISDIREDKPRFALKLGYGRPLGLGSVTINVKENLIFDLEHKLIKNQTTVDTYLKEFAEILKKIPSLQKVLKQWLLIHQYRGRTHYFYPNNGNETFKFHTDVRQKHAKGRRQQGNSNARPNQYTLQKLSTEK